MQQENTQPPEISEETGRPAAMPNRLWPAILITLVVGLVLGYVARPAVETLFPGNETPAAPAPSATSPAVAGAPTPAASPTADPTQEAMLDQLNQMVLEQIRHFKGDPNAPITVVEFADFQ